MSDIYEKYNIHFTNIKYDIENNENINLYDEFSLKKATIVEKRTNQSTLLTTVMT